MPDHGETHPTARASKLRHAPKHKALGLPLALGRFSARWRTPRSGAPIATLGLSDHSRQRVLDRVEADLAEDLSVESLAREAGLSPHHFARCFKATMGCTPHRYVQQRRLDRARTLLKLSRLPIAEIALELGFASQSHFTQAFRNRFGVTPAAARKH